MITANERAADFENMDLRLGPQEMIERMIDLVPADTGLVRNVVPAMAEDMLRQSQAAAWTSRI